MLCVLYRGRKGQFGLTGSSIISTTADAADSLAELQGKDSNNDPSKCLERNRAPE